MSIKKLWPYLVVIACWIAYFALTFLAPVNEESGRAFGLSQTSIVLLRLTIAVPYLMAWLAGCYGCLALISASKRTPEKEDATAYTRIAIGILVLLCGLIATSLISATRQFVLSGQQEVPSFTLIINYLYVFAPLAGFSFILAGSGHLRRGSADLPLGWYLASILVFALFAVGYVWLIFTNPSRAAATGGANSATYYLPDAAIVLTIIIPFLAACLVAMLAMFKLARYYLSVTGLLYKRSAQQLILGLILTLLGSVLLQGLLSLGSSRLEAIGLAALLGVIYLFLAFQTLGFIFVALGARKLSVMESVLKSYEVEAPSKK